MNSVLDSEEMVISPRKLLFAILLCFATAGVSAANDIYLAQNAQGGNNGADCADAFSYTFFNNSGNWGGGSNQIGSASTVHLCGAFNGTPGQQLLIFQGSGTSGNPITLHFESGVVLSAAYWSAQGAINTNGNTWLTIDGGSNGTIQNTLNGTAGAACIGGPCTQQRDSRFVYITGCSTCNIEVKNLSLIDIYLHTPNVGDTMPSDDGVEGVFFSGNHSNITVDNILCHDAVICIDGWGNNIVEYNNELYNCNRCVVFGTNTPTSKFVIHDTYIHDFSVWDDPSTAFHHDGIHMFPNSGSANASGVEIYNNQFANPGNGYNTAFVYFEGTFTGLHLFNNVCINTPSQSDPCVMMGTGGGGGMITNALIANNTVIGGSFHNAGDFQLGPGCTGLVFENNIAIGGNGLVSLSGQSFSAVNNNVYEDTVKDGGTGNLFGYLGTDYTHFPAWQSALPASTGQDAASIIDTLSNLHVASDGELQSASPAIGGGANLTSLGIAALNVGKPVTVGVGSSGVGTSRPQTGAWDSGAYPFSNNQAPSPPTGLSASVQ